MRSKICLAQLQLAAPPGRAGMNHAIACLLSLLATAGGLQRAPSAVISELVPLIRTGGSRMTRNASTVASIDSCLDELAEAGRGRNLLEDAIFGNYEVAYFSKSVDGDRDGIDKKRPATRTIPRALAHTCSSRGTSLDFPPAACIIVR